MITLSNESAQLLCSFAAWDVSSSHLVAAVLPYTAPELFKAVKASLMTNANKYLRLRGPDLPESVSVVSARKGYLTVSRPMQVNGVGPKGNVAVILHHLCGSPQDSLADHCYLPVLPDQDQHQVHQAFVDRLNLAMPWPVAPHWGAALFAQGLEAGAVFPLPTIGSGFYTAFYRIQRDEPRWMSIIDSALQKGHIQI